MHTYHSTPNFDTLLTLINKYTNSNSGWCLSLASPKGVSLILTAMCDSHKVCYGTLRILRIPPKVENKSNGPLPQITNTISPPTMSRIIVKIDSVHTEFSRVTCFKV